MPADLSGPKDHASAAVSRAGRLLRPRSIAVVGASPDFAKVNGRPFKHLLQKGYGGRLLPINPKYREIAGVPCFPDVDALPEAADLAIVAVPAQAVGDCIDQLGRRGVSTAVIFSSGFGEMGDDGKRLEASLVERARRAGVAICGPNCLGFINAFDRVYATFSQYADGETGPGPVAFATQSGAFGTAIAALLRQRGLGLGYFINTGNEAGLSFSDLMLAVIEDPRITVCAGYLEGVRDGAGLVRLAKRCLEVGKPLVMTKVGRLAAGARAAASHTGSLAVEDEVFDAVMRQHGVLRARNEEQLLDMVEALCTLRAPAGNGLGIATQSGGAGVMMADRAEEVGLAVPRLAPSTQAALATVMPAFGTAANPVDVTGQFVAKPELLRNSVVTLLDDPAIHLGIVWLQLMTAHVDLLTEIFLDIQGRTDKPWAVCWVAAPPDAIRRLRTAGILVFGAGERAVEALAACARYREVVSRLAAERAEREHVAGSADRLRHFGGDAPADGVQATVEATRSLALAGVPMVPAVLADNADEAVAAWRRFGQSVVLKVESPDITHKTEVDGVALRLNDEASVRDSFARVLARAASLRPAARIWGAVIQPMVSGSLELVVGAKRDGAFGIVVMVGLGGIFVEVLRDVAFRQAPFPPAEALRMLDELRGRAVFDGARGRAAVDRGAIARFLSDFSIWAAAAEPWLEELDLNPVLVGDVGPLAVDCVMVARHRPTGERVDEGNGG